MAHKLFWAMHQLFWAHSSKLNKWLILKRVLLKCCVCCVFPVKYFREIISRRLLWSHRFSHHLSLSCLDRMQIQAKNTKESTGIKIEDIFSCLHQGSDRLHKTLLKNGEWNYWNWRRTKAVAITRKLNSTHKSFYWTFRVNAIFFQRNNALQFCTFTETWKHRGENFSNFLLYV